MWWVLSALSWAWLEDPPVSVPFLGNSAGAIGDLDGDGFGDVWGIDGDKVSIFRGSVDGLVPSASQVFRFSSRPAGYPGLHVSSAGDIDGDGRVDLVVSACDGIGLDVSAWVLYGEAGGTFGEPVVFASGPGRGCLVVAGVGDVDNDGYQDVALGAPFDYGWDGAVYVYLGSPAGLADRASLMLAATGVAERFGTHVIPLGDVNGDGYADLAVNGGGQVRVYYGSSGGTTSRGASFRSHVVTHLRRAGDVDGDGFADLVVVERRAATRYDVFVYRGSAAGLGLRWASPFGFGGGQPFAAGDYNGDGRIDLVIPESGQLKVFDGLASGLSSDAKQAIAEPVRSTYFQVAAVGDVNGDGYADALWIGARRSNALLYLGYRDDDEDGVRAEEDCDDNDDTIGAEELRYRDADLDGYGTDEVVNACPNKPGSSADTTDCDDTRDRVNPGAGEVCDEGDVDEDCDGLADDADPSVDTTTWATWYEDADGDGYGSDGRPFGACDRPAGHVTGGGDCDDEDPAVGMAVTHYRDADEDGWGGEAASVRCPGADGYATLEGDCDEQDPKINPGATEVCDGFDNDCDGAVDAPIDCRETDGTVDSVAGCGCASATAGGWGWGILWLFAVRRKFGSGA